MRSIGIIDAERLALLPSKHWRAHEFCFYLHDQLVQLLIECESSGAQHLVTEAFERALVDTGAAPSGSKSGTLDDGTIVEEIDVLRYLREHNLLKPYKHHIISHLVLGLTSDMLHFLFEALSCFEKRKFAVGFALLRKPLKENLLFLSWLLADQDDFITRFEANTHTTLNGIPPDRRVSIMAGAIDRLATKEAFNADLLNDMIFSKAHPRGFEPIWQRATHLITSHGTLLQTEDLNVNFIFHDARSDHLFELLYSNLPYVLAYVVQVALECFAHILQMNEQTVSHLIITTMGCFETLFESAHPQHMARMLSKHLRTFLKCLHCDAPLRLTRANAAELYLREQLRCHKCGLSSPFPLYWLLAKAKVKLIREDATKPILRTR